MPKIDLLVDAGKQLLREALSKQGFSDPTVDYKEDETSLNLVIAGTNITGTGTVTQDFEGRFWAGKLELGAEAGFMSHDRVSAVLTLRHQVLEDRPHTGDKLEGTLEEVASLSISASGNAGVRKKMKRTVSRHPLAHSDIYVTKLSGEATNDIGFNNLTSYKLEVKAVHTALDQEFLIDPSEELGCVILTPMISEETGSLVAVFRGDDKVHDLSQLSVAIDHGNTLQFITGGVRAHGEVTSVAVSPSRTKFSIKFVEPVGGPGSFAFMDFNLMEVPLEEQERRLSISRIEAFDSHGQKMEFMAVSEGR